MNELKQHLIESGFDAISENEFENDKMNVTFNIGYYSIVYAKGNRVHIGIIMKLPRFKQVIKRINSTL